MDFWIWATLMFLVGSAIGYCAAKYEWRMRKLFGAIISVLCLGGWLFLKYGIPL